jgi:hypothetical protein
VYDRLEVDLLRRHEWKSRREVETHLVSEHAEGARARAVPFGMAMVEDVL